jgi:hypothetical protein
MSLRQGQRAAEVRRGPLVLRQAVWAAAALWASLPAALPPQRMQALQPLWCEAGLSWVWSYRRGITQLPGEPLHRPCACLCRGVQLPLWRREREAGMPGAGVQLWAGVWADAGLRASHMRARVPRGQVPRVPTCWRAHLPLRQGKILPTHYSFCARLLTGRIFSLPALCAAHMGRDGPNLGRGVPQVTHEGLPCDVEAPTCGATCGKLLPCGQHHCAERCHIGECPSTCRAVVEKSCACGRMQKTLPCSDALRWVLLSWRS